MKKLNSVEQKLAISRIYAFYIGLHKRDDPYIEHSSSKFVDIYAILHLGLLLCLIPNRHICGA